MNITSAKYIQSPNTENGTPINKNVLAVIDGLEHLIPINQDNRHYQEILEWVEAGNTIEAATTPALTWADIRFTRDQILRDTDWTMTTGASVDQAQWAAYRQNIRDIPQTYSGKTPDEVVWPTQPSTAGPNT